MSRSIDRPCIPSSCFPFSSLFPFHPILSLRVSAQVITRGTRSAGYGFVTVKTLEAAQKACEQLDKKDLEGRQVVIEIAKPAEQKDKERAEKRASRRAGRPRGRAPPGEVTEEEASGEVDKQDVTGTTEDGQAKRKNKKKRINVCLTFNYTIHTSHISSNHMVL